MTKSFPLQPLVHLAHQKNDAAARKFGQLIQHQQAAEAKLETLLQYRKDYQARFEQALRNGINHSDLRNFQDFIKRLDQAIAQQSEAIEQVRRSVQAGRNELQQSQQKMKSFDTLAQRHLTNEKKLEAKSEQRLQDEHSGRASAIKATAAKDN